VAETVGSTFTFVEAVGGEVSADTILGNVSSSFEAVGSTSTYFVLTPHRTTVVLEFTHWGQTDIFFGGNEMDVAYSELD
jgi:hypothetical protein